MDDLNNYDIDHKCPLGQGGFGSVLKGVYKDGTVVAMKRIAIKKGNPNFQRLLKMAQDEIEIGKGMKGHPHIPAALAVGMRLQIFR